MSTVTVRCTACGYADRFGHLGGARAALEAHQDDTGHHVEWTIEEMAEGVAVMGRQAGVCGRFQRDSHR
jgi:hypothetical protein